MRQAAARTRRSRKAVARSTPAPIRGWNARDAIAAMRPTDAAICDNWWPSAADVMLRKGSADHVTGITGEVETLAAYRPASGSQVLFGFAGTSAYNVSAAGAVGAAVLTTLTNARWQTINFRTTGGHFMLCANGADSMRRYDGTTWDTITGAGTGAITGVATNTIIGLHVHKERVWMIPVNSTSVWYLTAGAIAGAAVEFPLGAVFKKGGYVVAMGTWSFDGGNGPNDVAVFISSEGEVAVYAGTNPASAADWGKIAEFAVGTPIGRRPLVQVGTDLLIITTDGVIPCSRLKAAKEDKSVAITDSIQQAMATAVERYGTSFGWSATLYPGGTMLVLNVPIAAAQQHQYVMNTITKRWARFRPLGNNPGWPAWCFEVFNGALYFGGSGAVVKAWTGNDDNGAAIEGDLLPAFNYFGDMNRQKHFKAVRPIIGWDSNPAEILIGIDVDFIQTAPTSSLTLPGATGGVWDTGIFDSAVWGGDVGYNRDWYGAENVGFAGSMHLRVKSSDAEVRLVAISYLFELGEVI